MSAGANTAADARPAPPRGGWPVRPLLRLLSPGGRRGLSIMIYHRVLAAPDPLFPGEIDREAFSRHLGLLKSSFNVLALQDAVRLARAGRLPPRAACITFDDGYADNAVEALPILQRFGLTATFFVATGFLDGGRMWNDTVIELVRRAPGALFDARTAGLGRLPLGDVAARRAAIGTLIGHLKYLPMEERLALVERLAGEADYALPQDLMMSSGQVRQLHAAGMGVGAHTVNHPILAAIPARQAGDEIAAGKQRLETLLGAPVPLFAYPNGKPDVDYRAEHVGIVRELGFEGAVSTAWGGRCGDLYQLPRFTPWDLDAPRFQLRLALNLARRAQRVPSSGS
ncbi:peptidoglycan/xylan/chitin deacetylase (PgdA/CDA1 family) [Duganella sp. 1411]|uniref:polysaccharide deacetylase family protein n=1 Tax=Duganella sp. 1411 TaxID=2806572 RepID=UPI001AE8E110|nr:polysaccharide deacetylase family protein [Duganella sp. 1411]MBP1202279.1 peptidoglycan/xylan/chitin deacetylase (PgdA/CDA1 family) [Duganella sp. 1411]